MIPTIDWSISLGQVIHLVGILLAGAYVWGKLASRLDRMELDISRAPKIEDFKVMQSQVSSIWEWFTQNLERRRGEDRQQ